MYRTCFLPMLFLLSTVHPLGVAGHGFLRHPPGRSSMWLFGYNTPPNYQHMEMFCGGFPIQWWVNDGKCGVCGDPYGASRENEPPYGRYARGIITQTYTAGSVIMAIVHVTASHRGYFEFRLCPHNDPKVTVTQDCLDQNLLKNPITMRTKFFVDDKSIGIYDIELQLPAGVTCDACVLQWRYRTGNRWGCYDNNFTKGPCGLGFGPQEEFYACADIRIIGNGPTTASSSYSTSPSYATTKLTTSSPRSATNTVSSPGNPTTSAKISTSQGSPTTSAKISTSQTITTTSDTVSTSQSSPTTSAKISTSPTTSAKISTSQTSPTTSAKISTSQTSPTTSVKVSSSVMTSLTTPRPKITSPIPRAKTVCKAVGPWKNFLPMDNWCRINCARNYCPPTHCLCRREDLLTDDNGIMNSGKTCISLRPNSGWDLWCQHNCPMGLCYPSMCRCGRINVSKMVQHNLGR